MTRWLSAREQRQWRAWLTVNRLLPEVLERDLREHFDIGMGEYEILVHLSESPDGQVRMADLAHATLASRSKLTHQISRMENAGWVSREKCAEDQRGLFAVLTDEGWSLIRRAAPIHVESVRRHLLNVLGDEDFGELGRLSAIVAAPLAESMPGVSPPLTAE